MLKILVVEDLDDNRETLVALLEIFGHTVIAAANGNAALELADQSFDVGLLDIGLPGMSGLELAARLRTQHATASMMLIALSGYGTRADVDASLAAGFHHHFTKPLQIDRLMKCIEVLIAARKLTSATSAGVLARCI